MSYLLRAVTGRSISAEGIRSAAADPMASVPFTAVLATVCGNLPTCVTDCAEYR